ncbi:MAG: hypothetical protein RR623_06615 [Bacilli bacterium]
MLPKELITDVMKKRRLSLHDISTLTGMKENKIEEIIDGYLPSEKVMNNICNSLNVDINDVTYDELNISVNECAKKMGKSPLFVKNAIRKGRFPGSYVEAKELTSYHIPRNAFYTYMGMQSNSHVLVALELFTEALKKSLPTE